MTLIDDRRATVRHATRRSAQGATTRTARRPGAARTSSNRDDVRATRAPGSRPPRRAAQPVAVKPSGVLSGLADVPFIVPIVLLVIGALGLTLFLSTTAAQDSYALESIRQTNRDLTEKRDSLQHAADAGDSSPELADKAAKLGMVPGAPGAAGPQLVVGPDGKARLKGRLAPSDGSRLGSLNPTPDPVTEIDPNKVDDSGGLAGNPAPATSQEPATPEPTTTEPAVPEPAVPESAAPEVAPPTMTTPTPTPNVLPQNAAVPGSDLPEAR
ncbi:MAG: hypothetical protein QM809_11685 [Gordonia sp. (in: high G+C Gram-positive bacteria)]|uniref:hypothetical protein n=1 Tax=Gordonia sp. (in: high G+C Gram-positive bacteria) TaxID=84139 RepID=UPI0039E513E3